MAGGSSWWPAGATTAPTGGPPPGSWPSRAPRVPSWTPRRPTRPAADLVVDAAYGTGLSRPYRPPDPGAAPVLAVDIPSGLAGLTGRPVGDAAVRAVATVTFAAYKPGLLLGVGPEHSGVVTVVDIGLEALVDEAASAWLVGDADVARLWVAGPATPTSGRARCRSSPAPPI